MTNNVHVDEDIWEQQSNEYDRVEQFDRADFDKASAIPSVSVRTAVPWRVPHCGGSNVHGSHMCDVEYLQRSAAAPSLYSIGTAARARACRLPRRTLADW